MLRHGWKSLMLCGLVGGWGGTAAAQAPPLPGEPTGAFPLTGEPTGAFPLTGEPTGAFPSGIPTTGIFAETAGDDLLGPVDPLDFFEPRLPPDVFYAKADYLLWWVKKAAGPEALVTVGDPDDDDPGALGQPGTVPILGGGTRFGAHSGGRLTFGAWDGPEQTIGWELSGFLLEKKPNRFDLAGQGRNTYVTVNEFFGGEFSGTIDPNDRGAITQYSHFGGLQAVMQIGTRRSLTFDGSWFGGIRYQRLAESFSIDIDSISSAGGPVDEVIRDSFRTRSQFFGGYFGGKFEKRLDIFLVRGRAGVGLGYNRDYLAIAGSYENLEDPSQSLPGGVYAQPSNSGVQRQNGFAATTDFSIGLGANLTRNLRFTTDYDFSYWSRTIRPGEQLDRNVNSFSHIAGPQIPPRKFETSSFYAQGVTFGLEYHY